MHKVEGADEGTPWEQRELGLGLNTIADTKGVPEGGGAGGGVMERGAGFSGRC